jgi:hypothetical protein
MRDTGGNVVTTAMTVHSVTVRWVFAIRKLWAKKRTGVEMQIQSAVLFKMIAA